MMRFFTRIQPKIPYVGFNIMRHPECLVFERGHLVPCGIPLRRFAKKGGKDHPYKEGVGAREEKQEMSMPGFVNPQTFNEEGYFTQKAKQQIEEQKKKKDRPTLHNPEGRE